MNPAQMAKNQASAFSARRAQPPASASRKSSRGTRSREKPQEDDRDEDTRTGWYRPWPGVGEALPVLVDEVEMGPSGVAPGDQQVPRGRDREEERRSRSAGTADAATSTVRAGRQPEEHHRPGDQESHEALGERRQCGARIEPVEEPAPPARPAPRARPRMKQKSVALMSTETAMSRMRRWPSAGTGATCRARPRTRIPRPCRRSSARRRRPSGCRPGQRGPGSA